MDNTTEGHRPSSQQVSQKKNALKSLPRQESQGDWFALLVFRVSLVVLAFLVGAFLAHTYQPLREGVAGVLLWMWKDPHHLFPPRDRELNGQPLAHRPGAQIFDREACADGVTLLTSYWSTGQEPTAGIHLVDLDGTLLHRWDANPAKVWPDSPHDDLMKGKFNTSTNYVHGTYLFENGDLLFSIDFLGTVRMDAAGNIKWRLPRRTHHAIFRDHTGNFWACALRYHNNEDNRFPLVKVPGAEDYILQFTPEGKILREISILGLLYEHHLENLMFKSGYTNNDIDPLHLNDVEVLSPELAEEYPLFEAGDVMVSLKHVHCVMVFSPETHEIKWRVHEPFIQQHDPDFIGDGWVMIFDNNMGPEGWQPSEMHQGSSIIAIKPETGERKVLYPGENSKGFYTRAGGKVQLLPNGNLLFVESRNGRAIEATPEGREVWEWRMELAQASDGRQLIPEIMEATRYPFTPEQVKAWRPSEP